MMFFFDIIYNVDDVDLLCGAGRPMIMQQSMQGSPSRIY